MSKGERSLLHNDLAREVICLCLPSCLVEVYYFAPTRACYVSVRIEHRGLLIEVIDGVRTLHEVYSTPRCLLGFKLQMG